MMATKTKQAAVGHSAGIYADMTLDGPAIGTLVIVVDRAKNLPNRKTMGKQDPYCAMRLAKEAKKTATDRRGGQTPKWDQELRFDVHDAPDYYKLKCSVFNDDKKTDLIGEAWMDLAEVIKPGGGQCDVWQQLNFKGKYAGDIRIELTYYDSREKPVESRASNERRNTSHISNDGLTSTSTKGNKQLGPRDLQKRPLPANPIPQHSQTAPLPPQIQQAPQYPFQTPFVGNDYGQAQIQMYAPVPVRPSEQHQDEYREYDEDSADHYVTEYEPEQVPYHECHEDVYVQEQQPWQYPLGKNFQDYSQASDANHSYSSVISEVHSRASMTSSPLSLLPSDHSEGRELSDYVRPRPYHANSEPSSPYSSPPAARPMPSPANSDGQLSQHRNYLRSSGSPTKAPVFKDSPLRYSMNHPDEVIETGYDDVANDAIPPPPPPKHRDTTPQRDSRGEYPPTAYLPQPLRLGAKRTSFTDRSPLQSLEDSSNARRLSGSTPPLTPNKNGAHDLRPIEVPQHQIDTHHRSQSSYDMSLHSPHDMQQTQNSYRQDWEDHTVSNRGGCSTKEPKSNKKSMHKEHFGNDSSRSPQTMSERRSVSPNPSSNQHIRRKSVGMDGPYPSLDGRRLSAAPFGPDSYDFLNPGSSPITNEGTAFETPEQARNSTRMREVENARNQGPIIDNDGNEIDPSDHLPTDTWAPEPEKKQKKPEHIIHIRSRNSPSTPLSHRASPNAARTSSNSPYQPQHFQSSPQPSTPSHSAGRNRLQKPISTRPLPVQPYQRPQSQEPMPASEHNTQSPNQYNARRNSYRNESSGGINRPSPAEYQVPIANRYIARESPSTQQQISAPLTPTKGPNSFSTGYRNQEQRHSYYGGMNMNEFDDPLVAEMSMIDIGPSRGSAGRTRPRQNRGY